MPVLSNPKTDPWQEIRDAAWAKLMASREARGYKSTPSPPWLSKMLSDMPNWYLEAVKRSDASSQ